MPDTKPKAPPAPAGPASPPPSLPAQSASRRERSEPEAIKPPFDQGDVVELARSMSGWQGDNPDAYRFGSKRYEEHLPLAKAFLHAIVWWEARRENA